MALKLMYITNDGRIARIAENSGVDWIFIDLELYGKEERQGHLDTVISRHSIEDVQKIKNVLKRSRLLVRVNSIYEGSAEEISRVIKDGADIVMLPFFKTREEVEQFLEFVDGRAEVCLLLETPEAVENIDSILDIGGIDHIHIGLNDLHLGYGMHFMFELLADGTVERLCRKIGKRGIPFGFGGIAQLHKGDLPAEYIISEHCRLGSTMAILSRSFCNINHMEDIEEIREIFDQGVRRIRAYEESLQAEAPAFFEANRRKIQKIVEEIVRKKTEGLKK